MKRNILGTPSERARPFGSLAQFCLALLLLAGTWSASAAVLWVDPTSNPSNPDGTRERPFGAIQRALDASRDGDTLRLKGGREYSGSIQSGKTVTFESFDGIATLNGQVIIGEGVQEKDTDGDGIPDQWERFHGLNPRDPADAARDLDRDALTNLQEYERNTNPKESDLVGSLSGQFSVDPHGSASYTIPISIPPGTAGMQPTLSVALNSRAGNQLLGVGGTLVGLSSISRCPQTIAQDGVSGAVNFDANDRFCLDGQRLIAVKGEYGADGTEYRTEIESFARIISHGRKGNGPRWFQVWTKSGQVLEYGRSDDSQVLVPDGGEVRLWARNKVSDVAGNYVNYSYQEDQANGTHLLKQIDYTGNAAAGLEPYCRISFVYESRPDPILGHVQQYPIALTKRLQSIRTSVDGETVNTYKFRYEQGRATGRSRLISAQTCDANDVCLPETTFSDWTDVVAPNSFAIQPAFRPSPNYSLDDNDYTFISGDINGDGRTDLIHIADDNTYAIWISRGDGTFFVSAPLTHPKVRANANHFVPGDYNGDGKIDFFHVVTGDLAELWLGRADGTLNIRPVRITNRVNYNFDEIDSLRYYTGDFNGDGRTDLFRVADQADAQVLLSLGNAEFSHYSAAGNEYRFSENDDNFFLADLNGDGRSDFIHFNPSEAILKPDEYWLWLSEGEEKRFKLVRKEVPASVMEKNTSKFQSGDFDGDGRTDFLHYFRKDSCEIWLARGIGEFDRRTITAASLNTGIPNYNLEGRDGAEFTFFVADFNGDQKTDIIHFFNNQYVVIWISQGDGTFLVRPAIQNGPNGYALAGSAEFRYHLGDFNGDGISDFLHLVNNERSHVWLGSGPLPDMPRRIRDGLRNEIAIEYKPLTDPSIYSPGTSTRYPESQVLGPMYVVAEHRSSDGIGGNFSVTRHYKGAKANLLGRGFLGFEEVSLTDSRTKVVSETTYHQEFPFIGQVRSAITKQPNGKLLAASQTDWAFRTQRERSIFVFNQATTERSYDLASDEAPVTQTVTSSTYDDFGNPTRILSTTLDGHIRTTTSTYENRTEPWHLGRLMTSSVRSQAPEVPALSRATRYEYDERGLLSLEVVEPESDEHRLRTTHRYDAFGNRTNSTVSAAGIQPRTVTTVFNDRGRFPIRVLNPLGHAVTSRHDKRFGSLVESRDSTGLRTNTWTYDSFGRLLEQRAPTGVRTFWLHAKPDSDRAEHSVYMVRSKTEGEGPDTTFYDSLGRTVMTRSVGFDGRRILQHQRYDKLGRLQASSRPRYVEEDPVWTEYSYDLLGRPSKEVLPGGATTTIDYVGLRTVTRNPLGQRRTDVRNSQAQVIRAIDNTGKSIAFRYDAFGNLLESTDFEGNATIATFDLRGQRRSLREPGLPVWKYFYNPLGELVRQEDGKGQVVSMEYDLLGRLVLRTEAEGETRWYYDTAANGIGLLHRVEAPEGYREVVQYDTLARPVQVDRSINNQLFVSRTAYDALGRVVETVSPDGFSVTNEFNVYGYLVSVTDRFAAKQLWRARAMNASDQILDEVYGNGLTSSRAYSRERGWLRSIRTGPEANVQRLGFDYDELGNLKERHNRLVSVSEVCTYDDLNRLLTSKVTGQEEVNYRYDDLGNVSFKTGVGNYRYNRGALSPYAVASIEGPAATGFAYDQNGNQTSGSARSVVYSSFNRPLKIQRGNVQTEFSYGPHRERLRQVSQSGDTRTETIYIGDSFELVRTGGTTESKSYVLVGSRPVAIRTRSLPPTGPPVLRTQYVHVDHLGSVETLTADDGQVLESSSYEPHGKRRSSSWGPGDGQSGGRRTERGFTAHLQLDSLDLVHMGGRAYDPVIGRFLSPDIAVQLPANLQAHNRYSYVLNNPLSFTDSSGFFIDNVEHFGHQYGRQIGAIAAAAIITYATGGVGGAYAAEIAFTGAVAGGATAAAINSQGDWRAIGIGAASAGLLYGIGSYFEQPGYQFGSAEADTAVKAGAHGLVGGTASSIQGGRFKSGFLSGFVADITGPYGKPQSFADFVLATTASSIAGGLGAELGGGKFKNGAVTGAFSYLFNEFNHDHEGPPDDQGGIEDLGLGPLQYLVDAVQTVYTGGANVLLKTVGRRVLSAGKQQAAKTLPLPGRSGAFRSAKEAADVPRSAQPSKVYHERIYDQPGNVRGRVYEFTKPDGSVVTIREHSLGHAKGGHGPHFNVEIRPPGGGPKQPLPGGGDGHHYFEP